MTETAFAKSWRLSRFIARKDRVRIPLWLFGITFFTLLVPIALTRLYTSQEERDAIAEGMRNPAMTAMAGPGNLDHYTIGAMTAHQMLLITAVVIGLMNILLVIRHTRTDEEHGRLEMILSLPVGRSAYLHAVVLIICITNVLLSLLTGFGLFVLRIESMNLEGSLLYGAILGAVGIFFAGVTVLFAQLLERSSAAIGFAITVLVISYLIRAIGDVANDGLSWISPLGWVVKTEVYADNHWEPVFLMLAVSVVLFASAYYLHFIRDMGVGFLPSRTGRTHASPALVSPTGIALRLQRAGTIAWACGMFVIGLSYGSVLGDLESFFSENEMIKQFLASETGVSLTEQFISMMIAVMAILCTIPPVLAILKLYGEEKKHRIGNLLARSVSRTRLMAGYLLISAVNGFVMLSLAAIGLWVTGTAVMKETFAFGAIYGSAVVYYPAVLVMIGVAACFIGFMPKLNSIVWFYLFYVFIVLYLGGLFQFPDWIRIVSPFEHIPQLPVEEMDIINVFLLIIIAVVLMIAGLTGYRRRDIQD